METKIGEAAGKIWKALNVADSMGKTQLAKATGLTSDLVNQGIGWLAREGKIVCEDKSQGLKLKK